MARRSKKKKGLPQLDRVNETETQERASGLSVAKATGSRALKQSWWRRDEFHAALLIIAVVLAYLPVWQAGFIWDDDAHLTANACIVGPKGLVDVWTSSAAYYFPLTLTTWWFMHSFWGLEPLPYHLANVALHGACAILLWRLLLRLQIPGAWLGAALWALHPVQVESVAWVSEFINEQSGFFYLLAIWFYASGAPEKTREFKRDYFLALLCALLALLSKPSTVMLPVVLVLVEGWRGGRSSWREVAGLAPFFLLSTAMSGWTIWEQKYHSGASGVEWNQSWPERIAIAGKDGWFYLFKLAWPHPLIFVYPQWQVDAGRGADYLPTLAWAGALAGLWWGRKGPLRPVFFALAYFTISLFPVLGFFSVYYFRYSFVADHFQYLASMGPLALVGAGITTSFGILQKTHRFWETALGGILLLTLGMMTWNQCAMYSDKETLWRTTISRNPECAIAHNNLGDALCESGRLPEALSECETALRLEPDFEEVHGALGNILLQSGRVSDAIQQLETAIQINPDYAKGHNVLGNALLRAGRVAEAVDQYKTAIRIEPDYADAHNNLGVVFLQTGQVQEAIHECVAALQINPDYAGARNNLGDALLHAGRISEAIEQCTRSIEIVPDSAEAHYNLGNALFLANRLPEAVEQYEAAIRIKPDYAWAHLNLGTAFQQMGHRDEAKAHYERALRIDPSFQPALKALNALNAQGAAGTHPAPVPASH